MSVPVGGWRALPGLAVVRRQLSVGVGIVAARACGFVAGAIVARKLGPEGFGQYTLAFTVFASLLQLTSFADTWLVSRWGPAGRQPGVLAAVWRLKRDAAAAIAIGSFIIAVAVVLMGAVTTNTAIAMLLGVIAAALGSFTTALAALAQAESRFGLYTFAVAGPPALILGTTAALAAWPGAGPVTFVAVMVLSYVPVALYGLRTLAKRSGSPVSGLRTDLLTFGGWVTVGTVFYAVFQRIDVFFLGIFRSVSDVGQYGAAVRLSALGALGASIVGAALMPIGSRAETWADLASRRTYLQEASLAALGIAGVLGVAVVFTPWLIVRVFGEQYSASIAAAQILLAGQLVLGAQLPYYFALYAFDGRRWIAGISLAQLATAAVSGAVLSRYFGLAGAAWSNAITYVVGALGVLIFLLPRLRREAAPPCAAR